MNNCPNCGCEIEEDTVFCHNCGNKISNANSHVNKNPQSPYRNNFEEKKYKTMIVFGYLVVVVQLLTIFAAWNTVKVINADRLILYPLLCFILTFYNASKLVQNERTYIHSVITVALSAILLIVGGLIV